VRSIALLLPALLVILSLPLFAQGDTVTRNPACVQLRTIWKLEGKVAGARIGSSIGGVGDVNGDGLADFAVLSDVPWQWQVFYGDSVAISSTPAWTFDSATSEYPPVVGDFYGTGHKAVGFVVRRFIGPTSAPFWWLHLFRTDSNRLAATPAFIWPVSPWKDTTIRALLDDLIAADLDNDGDDEMILALRWVSGEGRYGQIWIYDGGPDFQMQTPSVIIKDPELNEDFYRLHAGDIDGDRHVDLMTVAQATGQQGNRYSFYWGTGSLPSSGMLPNRQLTSRGFSKFLDWIDCDGDGLQDLVTPGIVIWRSAVSKNPRERSWELDDLDIYLKSAGGQLNVSGHPGHLNSKRYEMVGGFWAPGQILFSGGPSGPDLDYDATYYPGTDGLSAPVPLSGPVGDVNGDGWDDAISGEDNYPDQWSNGGIAIIIAGGPYIPNDEPAVGVRQIALEQRTAALSLWPNPVREELNIVWRGDLMRMPRRFEIHDMLGRFVSQGSVPDGDGAAIWRCADQPSGLYMLSIYDEVDRLLASTRFVKF
jgi:hypothetical protein